MKTIKRILALILCLVTLAGSVLTVPAFADDAPGKDDISGAGSKLKAPRKGNWLSEYEYGYTYAPKYGEYINCYYTSETTKRFSYIEQGVSVTMLAYETGRYLVKTDSGDIFWANGGCISDHYVANGRKKSGDAETDAYGPGLDDMRGADSRVDKPKNSSWLDEYETRYIYAPKYHKVAYMYYYVRKPKKEGADIDDIMGKVEQGTEITLLAHENGRYLVESEDGRIFWISDGCTSTTFVAYGRSK